MNGMGEPSATRRDVISHRACDSASRSDPRLSKADRLLSAMMTFDVVCVHDGVLSALGCHSREELDRALAGFRYFGLRDVADLVESIAERADAPPEGDEVRWALEDGLEFEYQVACPDTAVDEAFNAFYAQRPGDFAAPSADDVARHRDTVRFIRIL